MLSTWSEVPKLEGGRARLEFRSGGSRHLAVLSPFSEDMGIAHVLGSSPFQAFSQGSTLCGVGIWISNGTSSSLCLLNFILH